MSGDYIQLGTPLRDASVHPRPEDFLPPVNAGKAGEEGNPHGPNVVSVQAASPRSGNAPFVKGHPAPSGTDPLSPNHP